jgi:A/G-specific adenine glycosylase
VAKSYTVGARLLAHYRRTARDLPWRRTHDPYEVLVSEVMLQQTQAARVTEAFDRFVRRFPTLAALAAAPLGDVLREWSGLGYNRRARDLHLIARRCPDGLPSTVAELDALPGIGAYTAGAIACFAFGRRVPFADTNIKRVLGRVFLGRLATEREAVELDAKHMPKRSADLWHHALMDLGATICAPRTPRCGDCPLNAGCVTARSQPVGGRPRGTTARVLRPAAYPGTDRRVRGAIVRALVNAERGLTVRALEKQIGDPRVARLVRALTADALVELAGRRVRLPG